MAMTRLGTVAQPRHSGESRNPEGWRVARSTRAPFVPVSGYGVGPGQFPASEAVAPLMPKGN